MESRSERTSTALTFGPFDWNAETLELRRKGVRVRLSGQPAAILKALLEEPGRLVTREDLRRGLWGDDTFVDFEQGLNTAVARLRQALRDSAEEPRYVETVPGQGYRFIGEVRGRASASASEREPEPVPMLLGPDARWTRRAWLAGGVGALAGAVSTYLVARHGSGDATPGAGTMRGRFVISGSPGPPLVLTGFAENLAIAPDGSLVVYGCHREGSASLYLRPIDETEGRYLPGTDIYDPFFSPDGMQIGYYRFADQSLRRVSSLGGASSVITTGIGVLTGASWSVDGYILYGARFPNRGLMRVPATGGDPEPVTRAEENVRHVLPDLLPDGRAALFTIMPDDGSAAPEIAVVDLESGEHRPLLPGSSPRYATTGHVLFVLEDRLMAVRFDAARRAVSGTPQIVARGIVRTSPTGVGQYALSRTGSLLLAVLGSSHREAVWVGRDGSEEPIRIPADGLTYPRISPDGRRVAFDTRSGAGGRIVLWDFERERLSDVSHATGINVYATWSRDGEHVAFYGGQPTSGMYLKRVADAAEPELWSKADGLRALYFFTPSGREVVFARQSADGVQLCRTSLDEGSEAVVLLDNARNADLSPDGERIVYQSDAGGRFEIYVRSYPSLEDGYQRLSTNGGVQPLWSSAGDEVFYIEPGPPPRLMVVAIPPSPAALPDSPRPLMDWPYRIGELGRTYDIARPEGGRFIAIKERQNSAPRAEIVLGWLDELESSIGRS